MKKYTLLSLLAFLLGICAPVLAQTTGTIRGNVKDTNGKPLDGATVELVNAETGHKTALKVNSKGEYFSIGIAAGTYTITLSKDGKVLDQVNKVPIGGGEERMVDFDLSKTAGQGAVSAEQQKKIEQVQKQNEKIKSLNASLAQAKELETAGNYDQAVTVLQQASQVDPTQDLIWAYLADAQRGAKKYPDAIESYKKALEIKPTSGSYHNGLADAYAKSGQTDKAVQEYAAAAQADPTNAAMYYYNEGAVFTNTGKVDEAIAAFDKTIQLDPNRADAYYWKGVNLMGKAVTKGDKMVAPDGTADAFNKYLSLQPNGQYAQPAKDMLASIGAPVETSFGKSKAATKKK